MELTSIVLNCPFVELQRLGDTMNAKSPTNISAESKRDGMGTRNAGIHTGFIDGVMKDSKVVQ